MIVSFVWMLSNFALPTFYLLILGTIQLLGLFLFCLYGSEINTMMGCCCLISDEAVGLFPLSDGPLLPIFLLLCCFIVVLSVSVSFFTSFFASHSPLHWILLWPSTSQFQVVFGLSQCTLCRV